jgi:REP element-mobilizing transposase RayT
MEFYKGRYCIPSTRRKGWDYASPGYYFITICTKNRQPFFGQIIDAEMRLSPVGDMARCYGQDTPAHFPTTSIDEFIVMPNHVHGIVIIEDTHVETLHATSQWRESKPTSQKMSEISPKPGSISTIIRSYKSAVTRWARENWDGEFAWQERFYDHIIRNDKSFEAIRTYICNNPIKWEIDQNNPVNYNRSAEM